MEEEEHHSSESQLHEEWKKRSTTAVRASSMKNGNQTTVVRRRMLKLNSIYSRLEELRLNLEQEIGFENFIEAYNKIKAIHEVEDENIDMLLNNMSTSTCTPTSFTWSWLMEPTKRIMMKLGCVSKPLATFDNLLAIRCLPMVHCVW
ncbi:uncharacterized protein ACWYII_042017 isoform 1-T3 [Salvelinus alpinus]